MRKADPYIHFEKPKSDTAHIVALGPSVKNFKPDGNLTIGCNDCFKYVPTDYLIVVSILDYERQRIVMNSRPKKLLSFMPVWVSHPNYEFIGQMHPWRQDRPNRLDKRILYHSNNTPFIQCSLAFNLGYKKIVLWGVDFMDHPILKDEALERTWIDFSQLQSGFLENNASMYLGSSGSVLDLRQWNS